VETNWAIGRVVFASVYMPSDSAEILDGNLIELQKYCESSYIPLIVGTDCNAHSQLWGSSDTNERGVKLMDFIMRSNLNVINQGHEPTFVIANRQEVLDITSVSDNLLDRITYWRVEDEVSYSDP